MTLSGRTLLLIFGMLALAGCSDKGPLGDEKIVYSAIGSSDSLGVGAFPLADGYTFRIQDELKDQGKNVALFPIAIPGANTDLVVNAVQSAVDKGFDAELATVWVGANDLINGVPVESFALDLNTLLGTVQDDMKAYVILANVPSLPDLQSFVDQPTPEVTEERVSQYNAVIRNQARARGIPVIDLTDESINGRLVSDFDGIHPDDDGHERIAKMFMTVIRPEL